MEMKMETKRMSRSLFGGLALASLLVLPVPAVAQGGQEGQPPGGDPMMDAMMKAAAPGDHHKALARLVGDWTYVNKMWMAPDAPPSESTGTVRGESILGGRYVRSTYKGDMGGMPFEGQATEGYDNVSKQFVSTWVDNMSTGIFNQTGTCDDAHKVCTSVGDSIDPMSGQKMTIRSVVTWSGDKSYVMEMFSKDASGKEVKMMEIAAKKK
jgi:Protein of unknown function (DUF1579)